ncbi:MAG TPA: hypothetical protein P5526_11270 [Anaerolineae bacterium]|nr:hypothetical protein [Anaerolineae bacterium]MCB0180291.1 hypothetical protein [Anaerolineae bacterium]MCB9107648.1 hypothetical protein [Anaerolineales bacterium]HRV92734.1 hypothetical protein [Anaerolineae bacterium]
MDIEGMIETSGDVMEIDRIQSCFNWRACSKMASGNNLPNFWVRILTQIKNFTNHLPIKRFLKSLRAKAGKTGIDTQS